MYNLIADFKKQTFTLYHDLKIELENIQPKEIPFLKHNTNIRHLNAFKNLFNYWFLKNGFKPLLLEEEPKEMTYKCIASETETYFFSYCIDNKNTIFYLKNIDAMFQKLPESIDFKFILELEQTAEKLGFEGVTAGGAVRHYWKKNYNGWYLTKYKYNTYDITDEEYNIISNSLRGGLNILNPLYKNKMLYNTFTLDINSLYPYISLNYALPYDKPIYVNYLDAEEAKNAEKTRFKYKTCIYKVEILKCKIKPNTHKWYSVKDGAKIIYPDRIREITYLWDFELERLKKDYDLKQYEIIGALCFKVRRGSFDELLNNLKELKENSEKGTALNRLSKQYLNSFLGKFATKRLRAYDTYKIDVVTYGNGTTAEELSIATTEAQQSDEYYLPLFSYITARARVFMAEYINDIIGFENFIYCDTDSITCFNCDGFKAIEKHPSKFGYFKIESKNVKAIFKKQKFYCKETEEGEIKGVCAGINNEYFNLTCEEFKAGRSVYVKELVRPTNPDGFPYEKYFKIYI